MYGKFQDHLNTELKAIQDDGLYKREREITSPQGAHVAVKSAADCIKKATL